MQTIKVMPDYGCEPLWVVDEGNMPPSSFPISDELAEKLWAWMDDYDRTLNEAYPPELGFATKEAEQAFVKNGQSLASRLQDELGSEYKVVYFNIMSNAVENV